MFAPLATLLVPATGAPRPAPTESEYDAPEVWRGSNSEVTVVDGLDGDAIRVSRANGRDSFAIVARKVVGSRPGERHRAGAYVRSVTPGMYVCLRIEEFAKDGALPVTSERCRPATTGWRRVRVRAQTTAEGSRLVVSVRVLAALGGTSFDVDGFRLR